ncbi:hypothetical protein P691DRAFT_730261 [Macrolepiota fuliginosa MF-IS2]|uniref:Uncharacterized protein n=1 Tax=Macrolepiota fuliginosa MF-IS2 TaxID=1400762 RepID=A0A9P6C4C6_9AGAR|nr:hypothetical protein P691DRAFT_730261 [Macrolepiota fuliginosa MF-IS2]
MPLTFCWWLALLALLQCASAQTTGTIHLFTSNGCTGSHMSCSNIPSSGCCSTGGSLFASTFLAISQEEASIQIHSNAFCEGITRSADAVTCFQPTFAFSAAHWFFPSPSKRDDMEASPEHKDCRRPDTITIIDADGKEVKITVPDGENEEYEHAFVNGNFTKLFKLANINRHLRFVR